MQLKSDSRTWKGPRELLTHGRDSENAQSGMELLGRDFQENNDQKLI